MFDCNQDGLYHIILRCKRIVKHTDCIPVGCVPTARVEGISQHALHRCLSAHNRPHCFSGGVYSQGAVSAC